ncbi:Acetolactate synthase large subunit [Streptomyces sp. 1222.5]|uniref:thiamine pyrophosphate-binding protein n=1 Tax=unclassified Streptomyces TaxID=2593676 RepID=UPI0008950D3F|nr:MULTISPECIES: thiamine pyrophosphate-binding protein [unclassified Streptomyces]PKW00345.1 thiamine pyrophosphate-dependent acetolactate synthase large subunit-like protein [Streptomyces sp. 5112.2]SED86041.1 Acetolactate synthase large subunit [Streptomyces sp. 1222.5]
MTTLAQAVGQTLADSGIRHAFGVVGGGNILATAALTAAGVRYTAARHEGGAMAMADAYFRATGDVAVCTTTHGPGITNTVTALADAAKNRSGAVLLCGDAPVSGPRPHDIDQSALLAALGVRVVRLTEPRTARADTAAAVRTAREERCPVAVFLPGDLVNHALPGTPGTVAQAAAGTTDAVAEPDLEPLLDALAGARRPLLLAGLGAWHSGAGKILRELGDRLGALFTTTVMAGGLFRDSPWSLGVCGGFAAPAAADLMGEADVVVAFGASLDTFTLHGGRILDPAATVVQVDVDGHKRAQRADLVVRGDAHAVAVRLLDAVEERGLPVPDWRGRCADRAARARTGWADLAHEDASTADRIDPRTLTRALAALLPEERTLVLDGGHFIAWPGMYWPVPDPAGFVFTGAAFQSIGLGLAGAVGTAVGRPDRLTVAAVGDGGALMGLPELDTLVRSGRPALVVVYDDAAYGFEEHMYAPQGADPATLSFADTDFATVARGLGATAVTVRRPDDLDAVRRWRTAGCPGTLVLDCKVVPGVIAPFLADLLERT